MAIRRRCGLYRPQKVGPLPLAPSNLPKIFGQNTL